MVNNLNDILISAAGESTTLVKIFRKTVLKLKIECKVYTYNMNSYNSLAYKVSECCFAVPRITSEDYMQVLQSICLGNHVKVVIPTVERELPILSANKDIFAKLGIHILTPDYEFVMRCMENHQFTVYLENLVIDISMSGDIHNYETLVDKYFTQASFAEQHRLRMSVSITRIWSRALYFRRMSNQLWGMISVFTWYLEKQVSTQSRRIRCLTSLQYI